MTDFAANPTVGSSGIRDQGHNARGGEEELIACIVCDALHSVPNIPSRGILKCSRCGEVLLRAPGPAIDRILASAVTTVILVVSALFFPFLQISAKGLKSATTLVETAFAFQVGLTAPLTVALIMTIIILPIVRALALTWAVLPIRLERSLLPHAKAAFRLANRLRPWSMVEVFIVGVVVALVKIGGMAKVGLGLAFWELLLILIIVILEASSLCEKTIWRIIEQKSRS